jgi:signal transduction histidine kinase
MPQSAVQMVLDGSDRERARLTALLEALPSAAVLFRHDGMVSSVNQRGCELFVIDARAPLATQHWNVVLQPLGTAALDAVRFAIAGVPPETRTIAMDDGARLVDLRATVFDHDQVLVSVVDATEREARRTALECGTRQLETLVDLEPSAVRFVELSGRITRQNSHAALEHRERQPATVRELWEMDAPHDVSGNRPLGFLDAPAMRALAGMTVRKQLLEVRRLDGQRMIEAYAAPMYDAQRRVVGAVLVDRDVTEREQLTQQLSQQAHERDRERTAMSQEQSTHGADELERLVEERSRALIASQEEQGRERRLSAIGQLAAGVMHDVNNALNPIMAAAYLLRHHAESPDAVRDYAERIRIAAEMGAATASRVGRFIRQQPLHTGGDEPLDLAVLADEVLDLTEPFRLRRSSSESGEVKIVRQFAPGAHTRGIPGEIREALVNLVQNAIDAMPSGGTLTIRTGVEGDSATIAVRDTGVGMSADVRERAFEPFFTTKGAKGSGLGLAEVYGIARRHRGTAGISSVPGRGTEVILRLPLDRSAPAPASAIDPRASTVPLRILVVEDHDDGRLFLTRILKGDGHEVEAVGTCAEARERLAGTDVMWDLMLTDVGLPDGSGWDLAKEIKGAHPQLRIGIVTGWEAVADPEASASVEFVLRKPLRAAELKAHIAGSARPASNPE